MRAEIIAVGSELLRGHIMNTDAYEIARRLSQLGIDCLNQQVVGDDRQAISQALRLAHQRADLVVLTGGLGPTLDDLTKEVLADYLGVDLVVNAQQWATIQSYLKQRGRRANDRDQRQAWTFAGGHCFTTQQGLACGSLYQAGATTFICLPGPPQELISLLDLSVIPYLQDQLDLEETQAILTLNFAGLGESQVMQALRPWSEHLDNPVLGIYAKPLHIQVTLRAKGTSQAACQQVNHRLAQEIIQALQPYYLGQGDQVSLASHVLDLFKDQEWTLATCESLTGGGLASELTRVAGASQVVKAGFVVYQVASKVDLLGIDSDLIEQESVYSHACAQAMAQKALDQAGTDYAVSLTGVAGPGPDQGHPAGEVYIAIASRHHPVQSQVYHFPARSRTYIRQMAVQQALWQLIQFLGTRREE